MSDEFIHPNWHVILIHFPLGLLGTGIIVELLSFLWPRSGFRIAGHWMILIGSLLCIPAATTGIYAFRDTVVQPGVSSGDDVWNDTAAKSHWTPDQWRLMTNHVKYAAIGSVVCALGAVFYLAASDKGRRRLYWPMLIVIIWGMAMLSVASYHSGESIYTQGTAVEFNPRPGEKPDAKKAEEAAHTAAPATQHHEHSHGEEGGAKGKIEYYIPPLQLHMLFAGLTVAIALGSLASMFRRWNREGDTLSPTQAEMDRMITAEVIASGNRPLSPRRELTPSPEYPALFPGRYWLATFLIGLLTALAGLWASDDFKLYQIRELFTDPDMRREHLRLLMHVILGDTLVILPLILAAVARASRKLHLVGMILSLILVLVAAGQIWMGVLLTFDSMNGPITKFNPPDVKNFPTTQG